MPTQVDEGKGFWIIAIILVFAFLGGGIIIMYKDEKKDNPKVAQSKVSGSGSGKAKGVVQDEKTGKNVLVECDVGFEVKDGKCVAIKCPVGQELYGNKCSAIECPMGEKLDGNDCVAIKCPVGQELMGSDCVAIKCPTGKKLVGNDCIGVKGVWRKGEIGDYSKRKSSELFTYKCIGKTGKNCVYPKDAWICADHAKSTGVSHVKAKSSGDKQVSCTFFDDDGVDLNKIHEGDIVDIENTSYTGSLHYSVP